MRRPRTPPASASTADHPAGRADRGGQRAAEQAGPGVEVQHGLARARRQRGRARRPTSASAAAGCTCQKPVPSTSQSRPPARSPDPRPVPRARRRRPPPAGRRRRPRARRSGGPAGRRRQRPTGRSLTARPRPRPRPASAGRRRPRPRPRPSAIGQSSTGTTSCERCRRRPVRPAGRPRTAARERQPQRPAGQRLHGDGGRRAARPAGPAARRTTAALSARCASGVTCCQSQPPHRPGPVCGQGGSTRSGDGVQHPDRVGPAEARRRGPRSPARRTRSPGSACRTNTTRPSCRATQCPPCATGPTVTSNSRPSQSQRAGRAVPARPRRAAAESGSPSARAVAHQGSRPRRPGPRTAGPRCRGGALVHDRAIGGDPGPGAAGRGGDAAPRSSRPRRACPAGAPAARRRPRTPAATARW